jgi:hypothetical protein
MKRNAGYWFLPLIIVPAFFAFFSGQYVIDTFFPDVTLVDLGAFYILGFISGLGAGLWLALYRTKRTTKGSP